ncbi:MAG: hypothetical protein ACM3SY_10230 [Candidatus Omnitrophota bacterium]
MDYNREQESGSGNEVYYCGSCQMKHDTSVGDKCPMCGTGMVIWDPKSEDQEDVQDRWEQTYGSR